jgi:hypothetical protein
VTNPRDELTARSDGLGEDPLVPADFSGWMGKIVDAFARSWRPLLVLQLLLAVPLAVLFGLFRKAAGTSDWLTANGSQLKLHLDHPGAAAGIIVALAVIALVLGAAVQLASLWVVVRQAVGRDCPLQEAFRFAAGRLLPLIGWQIAAAVLISIGLIAVVVPGICLAVVFVPLLLGVVGLEHGGIKRCFELARGQFLALFGRCCTVFVIALAYSELTQVITGGVFGRESTGWGTQLVSSALELPLEIAGMAFLVITYAEARGRRQQTSTLDLAKALESTGS